MHAEGTFAATLLDTASKALARGAVHRLSETSLADRVEEAGPGPLIADAEIRLEHLSEALAVGRPELLRIDLAWLAETYAARGMDTDLVRGTLEALRDEIRERLPEGPAELAARALDAALPALDTEYVEAPGLSDDSLPHVQLARRFLLAALEGRRVDAELLVLDAFDGGVPMDDLHDHVLRAVQTEVGRMWQRGEVHVAEEHLASRIVESATTLLRARVDAAPSNGKTVLVAAVPGNLHEIGGRLVADRFEHGGWRALFLGANTPAADLALAARDFDVDLVALSVGLSLNVRATANLITALRRARPDTPILVGGRPFAHVPDLWKDVGADGSAKDARDAVEIGTRLVEERD